MFHLMKGKTTMIYFNYTNILNRNLKSQFGIDMTDSDYSVRIDVYYVDQDDVTGNIAMVTSGTISISPFDKTNSTMCKKSIRFHVARSDTTYLTANAAMTTAKPHFVSSLI